MKYRNKFSDERLDRMCCYCGNAPDTRDHIPSKVLLDEPFPENLPVVPCCDGCNQEFSKDEEYFACLIECMANGTTDIFNLKRDKIRRILTNKPSLHQKLAESLISENGDTYFKVAGERIENVILKLAKGHAQYEASMPLLGKPSHLAYKPIPTMRQAEADSFFSTPVIEKFPEVGSRMFLAIAADNTPYSPWQIVQDGLYEFLIVSDMGRLSVRLVLSNFLAAEITWNNK